MSETAGATFARRLREVRQAAGLTQTELARRLSERLGGTINGSAVTKIEKNARAVRLDEAVYAAEVLGVPLASLVSDLDPIEAKLVELRRELEHQRSREGEADAELRQAMVATATLEREIEQLEASRRD